MITKMENAEIEYEELARDKEFVQKCENMKESLEDVGKVLDKLLPLIDKYDTLSTATRVELDLFFCFTLNCMYWVQLRIEGEDPTKTLIKDELQRVKAAMVKWQEVKDRDKRPKVNKEAAKRFVRSGLFDLKGVPTPQNKKIKFEDSD